MAYNDDDFESYLSEAWKGSALRDGYDPNGLDALVDADVGWLQLDWTAGQSPPGSTPGLSIAQTSTTGTSRDSSPQGSATLSTGPAASEGFSEPRAPPVGGQEPSAEGIPQGVVIVPEATPSRSRADPDQPSAVAAPTQPEASTAGATLKSRKRRIYSGEDASPFENVAKRARRDTKSTSVEAEDDGSEYLAPAQADEEPAASTMGCPERDAFAAPDPHEASFLSQNTAATLPAGLSGYGGPQPMVGAAVQERSDVETAEQPELEPSVDVVHTDCASDIDGAVPVSEESAAPVDDSPGTGVRKSTRRRGKKTTAGAKGLGQRAQKNNNYPTRPSQAYTLLCKEHKNDLDNAAAAIRDLPDNTPVSSLPGPKALSDADRTLLRRLAQDAKPRPIATNALGYFACPGCHDDFGLVGEMIIDDKHDRDRHKKEYHSGVVCPVCGMPVAARTVGQCRRHRKSCKPWVALVKRNWHWAWLREHDLVRIEVEKDRVEQFFDAKEKRAAKGTADPFDYLRRKMKDGEEKDIRELLGYAEAKSSDDEDQATGGSEAGPSGTGAAA